MTLAIERWQAETGRAAMLEGNGRSFAEVKEERIGTAPAESAGQEGADGDDAEHRPSRRQRKAA